MPNSPGNAWPIASKRPVAAAGDSRWRHQPAKAAAIKHRQTRMASCGKKRRVEYEIALGRVTQRNGSRSRTRTCDPMINSHLLYRLSYPGIVGKLMAPRAGLEPATQ